MTVLASLVASPLVAALLVAPLLAGAASTSPAASVGASSRDAISVDLRFSAGANLAYQLDCVSGAIQACGRPDFEALWRQRFLRTAADSAQLAAWGAMRRRYDVGVRLEGTSGTAPSTDNTVAMRDKVRIATLQATTVDDAIDRLESLLLPDDWLSARAALLHFRAPFTAWWTTEAAPRGEPFRVKLDALLARDDVRAQISRFAAFYGTTFPTDAGVPMQLILRPGLVPWNTSGQQVERHAVLEFLPNEDPTRRIDVAVHELCHFFFNTRAAANTAALRTRLLRASSSAGVAAHNLLNEAMATALGNAILARQVTDSARWRRLLATPMALYANPHVDKAARVLLPVMDRRLATTGTIDDPTFATEYLAGIDSAFGASVTSPALLLNELYLYADDALGDATMGQVRETIRPASMYASRAPARTIVFDDMTRMPDINTLFVLSPGGVAELVNRKLLPQDALDGLRRAARDRFGPTTLHAARRPSGAWWFIVVARDTAAAREGLTRLARRPSALVDAPEQPTAPKS